MRNGSPKLQLNRQDMLAVVRGALLAAGGAVVVYLSTEVIPNMDESTMLGAAVASLSATLLNALRRYLTDTR